MISPRLIFESNTFLTFADPYLKIVFFLVGEFAHLLSFFAFFVVVIERYID